MQLPDRFRPFTKPMLIAVTDNVQAKLYLVKDHTITLVNTVSTKLEHVDQDRMAIKTGGGMRSGDAHEDNVKWERETLYNELSKDLMHRMQEGEYEELALTAPPEHMNELKESLHIDVLKRTVASVEKLLTGDDPVDIVAHVEEERGVL